MASGRLAEASTPEQALSALHVERWLGTEDAPEQPIGAAQYAYLLTKAFGLPGGFLADLFPGPRYAFRELVFRGFFPSRGDPDDPLTGVEALRILGKVMDSIPSGGRS